MFGSLRVPRKSGKQNDLISSDDSSDDDNIKAKAYSKKNRKDLDSSSCESETSGTKSRKTINN